MKNKYNKLVIPLTTLLIVFISIWVITISITGSKSYYKWQFEKNNTADKLTWRTSEGEIISYDEKDLDIIIDSIIDYLFSRKTSMQVVIDSKTVFSNQAIKHMEDVKRVYNIFTVLSLISIVILIFNLLYIKFNYQDLKLKMFKQTLITYSVILSLLIILGIYMLIDFDTAFIYFHKVLFPGEAFDDAFFGYTSNYDELPHINNTLLITVLSIEVFYIAGFAIILFTLLISFIWLYITYLPHKKKRALE